MIIPLFKVFVSEDVLEPVNKVLMSGYIGQGQVVEEFERKLREYFNSDHVSTLNSGTAALHLAIHLVTHDKFDQDDEVLTPAITCTATNSSLLANSVRLKWVDVDLKTCNMDLDDLERKISPKTKAIMIVHWGGYPHDLDRIESIREKCFHLYGFKPAVIEDCAHSFGSKYKGKLIGTHGNYCCFSFQAIKHLTTGDGGMLICPTSAEHRRAKLLRWFGLDREGSADFRCSQNIQEWGYKFHLNDILASVGLYNFPHVPALVQRHKNNAAYYDNALANVSGVTLLENKPGFESAAWIYTMRVEKRDNFCKSMNEKEIHVSQVHRRNDLHNCFSEFRCCLPNIDVLDQDMICIPNGWWVTDEDRNYIAESIKAGW